MVTVDPGQECDLGRRGIFGIQDPSAAPRHARFEVGQDGRPLVRDLGSTNGTFVNGAKVSVVSLFDADAIRVGNTVYEVICAYGRPCASCDANLRYDRKIHNPMVLSCAKCMAITRFQTPSATVGTVEVTGAFVLRLMARLERGGEDGTWRDVIKEIEGDAQTSWLVRVPEIDRLRRSMR